MTVVFADALAVPLARRQFKVVSNPPFHITSALLHRRLEDPGLPLVRATSSSVGAARSGLFDPPPGEDAAIISIRRRR